MLSNAAFNALLKTLEEPPEHVKFIFATTEPNKILPTIISRCQRFDLRPIPTSTIAKHLQFIANDEGVKLDDPAAWAIAKGADGGMRDAQSMLDQLVAFCGDEITEKNVLEIFGFTSRETVANLATHIVGKDSPSALGLIHSEANNGKELSQLLGELIGCLRALLVTRIDSAASNEGFPAELWDPLVLLSKDIQTDRILALIDVLAESEGKMKWAANKRLHMEIGTIKAIQSLNDARISDVIKALAGSGPINQQTPSNPKTPSTPSDSPTPSASDSAPSPEPPKPETPKPETTSSTAPKPEPSHKKGLDALIDDAPEEPAVSESLPTPNPEPDTKEPEPKTETNSSDDSFYEDPLIQKALDVFKGTLKK
jgi:DNA polymerase-3 subunit gamma/tau